MYFPNCFISAGTQSGRNTCGGLSALLLGLGLCLSPVASGQDDVAPSESGRTGRAPAEEIVVIANRVPVPLSRVAASVTVIDADDIEAQGDFNLKHILQRSVGVAGDSNGGIGAVSALRVRGEEGYRTLVVMDGLKLSDPTTPQVMPRFEHLLSSGIGRVEILRGPQGLNYGADAGGVIRIDSRRPVDTHSASLRNTTNTRDTAGTDAVRTTFSADMQSGSRGTSLLSAALSTANRRGELFIAADGFRTDGYNARESDTALRDKDGYANDSLHLRAGLHLSDGWRGSAVYRRVAAEADYDGCGFPTVHDCQALYDLQAVRLGVEYDGRGTSHSLAYSRTDTEREDHALGIFSFGADGALARWEYIGRVSATLGFNLGIDLVFGMDLEQEESDTGAGGERRDNRGYYIEALSGFSERLHLSAGLRRDSNDDYGSHLSRRLSAAYLWPTARGRFKLKAAYGTGFRAPSLFEAAYNRGPFAFPPASGVELKEERSRGFEYGAEYRADNGSRFELLLFDQKIEDAILFDPGFSGYLQERGSGTSKGVEAAVDYPLGRGWRLQANLSRNKTERPDGSRRLRRPEGLFNLAAAYRSPSGRFRFNGSYRAVRDAVDGGGSVQIPLEDFEVLQLSGAYRISDGFDIHGRIENALDESYREVLDYRAPARAVYLGLRLRF